MKAVLIILMLGASSLKAQRFTFKAGPKDCNLGHQREDNPMWGVHWKMKRYKWHAFYVGVSLLTSFAGSKALPISDMKSAAYTSTAEGLGPHLLGHFVSNDYPINWRDWAFDLSLRSAPVVLEKVRQAQSIPKKILWSAGYVSTYLALYCYAEP